MENDNRMAILRLLAEAQQALVRLMGAPGAGVEEQAALRTVLEALQTAINGYLTAEPEKPIIAPTAPEGLPSQFEPEVFVDPTLREILHGNPAYTIRGPEDVIAQVNQAKATSSQAEYLAILHKIVPGITLTSEQFEQISAFLQALDYLNNTPFSINMEAQLRAADHTFAQISTQTIPSPEKFKLIKQTLATIRQYFVDKLTQDVIDIAFAALETVTDIKTVLPAGPLQTFFQLQKKVSAYKIEEPAAAMAQAPSAPPTPAYVIPQQVAAAIQLTRSAKWAGLLEQTEAAVKQVAERFNWEEAPDPDNPEQILYTYANGLKITYSHLGYSYYERNIDDAQLGEELQQKEKELAYAWIELVRPAILIEPVVLSGRSKSMIGMIVSEFNARHIQTELKTGVPKPPDGSAGVKGKSFLDSLTTAARRLDQFGRYVDKDKGR